ncbi:MAG: alkaline phosphatase family protein [Aggregatilineales bacterium]
MLRRFTRRKQSPRVLVIGLDCAAPQLIFDQFHDDLPVLSSLMQQGTYGILRSSIPCITVPAWTSMLSSRDPGSLGIYGFRNRRDYSYDNLYVADNQAVQTHRIWDIIGQHDKQSLVFNVPQTYPIKPLNGQLVSGFLTPGTETQFAYPAILRQKILKQFPDYQFDVRGFRTMQRAKLLEQLYTLTDMQYTLFQQTLASESWDFAMHMNIGTDRLHHAFWRYHDPEHRLYEPDNSFKTAIRDYYVQVDTWLGKILATVPDETAVLVVSDHGVKRMDGAIAINEWLWRDGWLSLKEAPITGQITAFDPDNVNWSQTRAWSTGGYYGRIFLNVQGREPQGTIPPEDYETVRNELAAALKAIPGANGDALNTTVYKPENIYQQVNGIAPDLMVYFGELHWRTVGSLGYGRHYTLENDTGADDANHAPEGLFILHAPAKPGRGEISARQLMDIAPTILDLLQLSIPDDMQGQRI